MYKKLLISFAIIVAFIFSVTFSFAADNNNGFEDAANGVRDIVGGAENAVEDAAKDVSNTSKDATGNLENDANKTTGDTMGKDDRNTTTGSTNNNSMAGNYTATRTSTTGDNATFMGMNSTAWTWLILGIAAIAIIALVWYYSMQIRTSNYDDKD